MQSLQCTLILRPRWQTRSAFTKTKANLETQVLKHFHSSFNVRGGKTGREGQLDSHGLAWRLVSRRDVKTFATAVVFQLIMNWCRTEVQKISLVPLDERVKLFTLISAHSSITYLTCITLDVCTRCRCFSCSLFSLISFLAVLTEGHGDWSQSSKSTLYFAKTEMNRCLRAVGADDFSSRATAERVLVHAEPVQMWCVNTEAACSWIQSGTAHLGSEGDFWSGSTVVLEHLAWRETGKKEREKRKPPQNCLCRLCSHIKLLPAKRPKSEEMYA